MPGKVDALYQRFLEESRKQREKIGRLLKTKNPDTGKTYTQSEIARELNISRQRVCQVVERYYR